MEKEEDVSTKALANPGEIETNPPSCYQIQQLVSFHVPSEESEK